MAEGIESTELANELVMEQTEVDEGTSQVQRWHKRWPFPPFLLALVQFGFAKALILVAAYILINTITDNVISPRVMGSGLDLSPLAVFISLVFWAWVLGLLGAIMAVPLLLITKKLL